MITLLSVPLSRFVLQSKLVVLTETIYPTNHTINQTAKTHALRILFASQVQISLNEITCPHSQRKANSPNLLPKTITFNLRYKPNSFWSVGTLMSFRNIVFNSFYTCTCRLIEGRPLKPSKFTDLIVTMMMTPLMAECLI